MRLNRISFAAVLLIVTAVLLSACGGVSFIDEERIKTDVLADAPDWDEDIVVENFAVLKRVSDEEELTDRIHVEIEGSTDKIHYLRYYYLRYEYDVEEKVWKLDTLRGEDETLWETRPIAGPSEETVKNALMQLTVGDAECMATITEDTLTSFKITEDETDLENGTSALTCAVQVENERLAFNGDICVDLTFSTETGEWIPEEWTQLQKKVASATPFTYAFKEDVVPELTQERFLKFAAGTRFTYQNQSVTLYDDVVKDLSVDDYRPLDDGNALRISGSFNYVNKVAEFQVDWVYELEYRDEDDMWYYTDYTYTPTLTKTNLFEGWKGTFYDGSMAGDLRITEINTDGTMDFLFAFAPMPGYTSGKTGSYMMNGTIDRKTLKVKLYYDDWVEKPSGYASRYNINGTLRIDTGAIEASSYEFVLMPDTYDASMPNVVDYVGVLSTEARAELDRAISVIREKYGMDVVLMYSSTTRDEWYYVADYYRYHEVGVGEDKTGFLMNVNLGDSSYDWYYNYGTFGDAKDILNAKAEKNFAPGDAFGEYLDAGDYAGAYRELLLEINRHLGGADADLGFAS